MEDYQQNVELLQPFILALKNAEESDLKHLVVTSGLLSDATVIRKKPVPVNRSDVTEQNVSMALEFLSQRRDYSEDRSNPLGVKKAPSKPKLLMATMAHSSEPSKIAKTEVHKETGAKSARVSTAAASSLSPMLPEQASSSLAEPAAALVALRIIDGDADLKRSKKEAGADSETLSKEDRFLGAVSKAVPTGFFSVQSLQPSKVGDLRPVLSLTARRVRQCAKYIERNGGCEMTLAAFTEYIHRNKWFMLFLKVNADATMPTDLHDSSLTYILAYVNEKLNLKETDDLETCHQLSQASSQALSRDFMDSITGVKEESLTKLSQDEERRDEPWLMSIFRMPNAYKTTSCFECNSKYVPELETIFNTYH